MPFGRRRARHAAALTLTLLLVAGTGSAPGARAAPPSLKPAAPTPTAPPPGDCERVERIEIDKSERILRAYCEAGGSMVMRISLGRSRGAKRRRGDLRTPVGSYAIAGALRSSRFHGFIPIDYPSRRDAAEALADERITEATYLRILRAHQAGHPPPQDTPLGGHLGIHGEGERWEGWSSKINWTEGCIAVSDLQLEILGRRLAPGVLVQISP